MAENYYAGLTSPGWTGRQIAVGADVFIALDGDMLFAWDAPGNEVYSWIDLRPSQYAQVAEDFWRRHGGAIRRVSVDIPAPTWKDTDDDVVRAMENKLAGAPMPEADEEVHDTAGWHEMDMERATRTPPPTKTCFVVCMPGVHPTYYAGNGRGVDDRDAAKKYASRAEALADMAWQAAGQCDKVEIKEIEDRPPSRECATCGGGQPSCPACHPAPAPDCMDCGRSPCGCLENAKVNLFLSGALGGEQGALEAALRRAGLANDVAVWHITGKIAARGPARVYKVRVIDVAALPSCSVNFGYSAGVIRLEVSAALMPFSNVLQFFRPEEGYEPAWPDQAAGAILGLYPKLLASRDSVRRDSVGRAAADSQRIDPGKVFEGALAEHLHDYVEQRHPRSASPADPLLFAYVYYRHADGEEESEHFPVSLDTARGLKAGADPRVLLAEEMRVFDIPAEALLRVSVELTDPGNTKDTTAEPVWAASTGDGWTLDDALAYVRDLQSRAMAAGWCLMLAGGVLNQGFSMNDLDLLAYPRTAAARVEHVLALLPAGAWSSTEVSAVYAFLVNNRRVEMIFQTWPVALLTFLPSVRREN